MLGLSALSASLRYNKTLETLDLTHNRSDGETHTQLCQALAINIGLENLELHDINLGKKTYKTIKNE